MAWEQHSPTYPAILSRNMAELLTTSNIVFFLGVIGVIFSVYNYFRNPQIKADTKDALMAQRLDSLSAQIINLRDNHIHSLQGAIEQTNKNVNALAIEVTRLGTIIDERIPKK